ncbi:MAG TPA: threonine/serine dehydratase, partial [Gaiellaceae bacterium]|nr:threonine/serine dehydratase [Gaiellaceae bacterium]
MTSVKQIAPTLAEIESARARLAGHARVTPVYTSETLSRRSNRDVWLKAENLQRTGAFKVRGAVNKLSTLTNEERAAGVIAASAGNHGQAVAWAARELGIKATVFMPEDAPMTKVEATRNYGAETVLTGAGFDEALAAATVRGDETGATFIHAFEDTQVIAGQGTLGLELAEQLPDVETFVLPIGGGGLAAGISLALRAKLSGIRIVGVQAGKNGPTIADGIAVKHPGELTMGILEQTLDDIVHVEDDEISKALTLLLERTKLVTEGAGAASVAALLAGKIGGTGKACCLLSGGNIDGTTLISVVRHGLTLNGRYLVFRTRVLDRPGELIKLLE